jgi:hypothetical protein
MWALHKTLIETANSLSLLSYYENYFCAAENAGCVQAIPRRFDVFAQQPHSRNGSSMSRHDVPTQGNVRDVLQACGDVGNVSTRSRTLY